ncbi:MAG: aminodeoxychorismate synthase component I [Melioribacteraceae bacterium]|nr:aminodeoxychorismate synthase component I [Melioribacteraceae bacterium]
MYKLSELINKVICGKAKALLYTSSYFDENAKSFLLNNVEEIICINNKKELDYKINSVDDKIKNNKIVLSLINYEAGYLLEDKFSTYLNSKKPLMKFLTFHSNEVNEIDSSQIQFDNFEQDFSISSFQLNETESDYVKKIDRIKNYIKEGDTYQVNYTVKANFNFSGSLINFIQNLIFNQSTQYSAIINDEDKLVISISPELFFSVQDNIIKSRPMKGTIKRGINLENDIEQKDLLKQSIKDRAENVMIVDLLRNDIGKLAKFNSVKVDSIYDIEKYETIYQLTSRISAELNEVNYSEIIKNLFPCGSITGAPKIRTMEIIHELENSERGIYTGAIGLIKNNKSTFNVAIRTIILDKMNKGEIGLGSGIVWDSDGLQEYSEVSLKSNFLVKTDKYFELFETMLFENGKIFLIDEHIERLKNAANYFLFKINTAKIITKIIDAVNALDLNKNYKIKLMLRKDGHTEINISEEISFQSNKIVISGNKINAKNRFQYFKTTNRELYNKELELFRKDNYFDVIYFNDENLLAEGAITNIFLFINDIWHTPSIKSGILNGVYRDYFIKNNNCIETEINKNDLLKSQKIILTNSVKKEVTIEEIFENEKLIWQKGNRIN